MKIIAPSVEIMRTGLETEFVTPEQFIERVGRTCYKSEDKITDDSAAKFVGGLIKRGHEAMIEHWNLIFKTEADWYMQIVDDWETLMHDKNITMNEQLKPFLRFTRELIDFDETRCVISGNMRAWRDYVKACTSGLGFMPGYMYGIVRNYPLFFSEYQDWVPAIINNTILHPIAVSELTESERMVHQNITVKFVCDRGVSHEIVRHRTASFAQESTRYCNYGLDKFGNEITVVRPSWGEQFDMFDDWRTAMCQAESNYFIMLADGATPQQARSVLPNSLKTEVIMTGNLDCWKHFFNLRCAPDAHPDIQEVANMAKGLFLIEKVLND